MSIRLTIVGGPRDGEYVDIPDGVLPRTLRITLPGTGDVADRKRDCPVLVRQVLWYRGVEVPA